MVPFIDKKTGKTVIDIIPFSMKQSRLIYGPVRITAVVFIVVLIVGSWIFSYSLSYTAAGLIFLIFGIIGVRWVIIYRREERRNYVFKD